MTTLESSEPCIGVMIPVRLVPQLAALLAALAAQQSKPTTDTTAEPAPQSAGPGVVKTLPFARTLRKVG